MDKQTCNVEAPRIGLLLERDGPEATREWVARTLAIYRRAVLDSRDRATAERLAFLDDVYKLYRCAPS